MDWTELSEGVFLVNVLGILYDPKSRKILIGKRENNPYIKTLSWVFPGVYPSYAHDLEQSLKEGIKAKTGLDIDIKKVVFAKTYPENREVLSVYYYCEVSAGKEKAADPLMDVKWVKPTEVKKYFTTSLHPKVFDFLKTLD